MNTLDALINTWFRTKDSSTSVFFPYGLATRGYLLSKKDEPAVRKFLKEFLGVSFSITAIALITVGVHALWLLALLWLWYAFGTRRLLKGKERVSEQYPVSDWMRAMALSTGFPTHALLISMAVILFAASVYVTLRPERRWLGFTGSVFFGACFIFELAQLVIVLQARHQKSE
jgi:hypothetical protein